MSNLNNKNIGLYGPHNMWYISHRCYNPDNNKIYSLTYDDNNPCLSIKHAILETGTPTEYLNSNRHTYELEIATKYFKEMMKPDVPDIIRTFNSITNDIEIISHSHVKIKNVIKSLSDLTVDQRHNIWSIIYPKVVDITGNTLGKNINIDGGDYIFAISSCITPLIKNGGIMPHEERLQATVQQLKSIRKICPPAKIFLLESSFLNFDDIERLYDYVDYIFLFEKNPTNISLASINKSLGESYIIYSLLTKLPPYKLFIKFSGRYQLISKFKLENLSLDMPTFRITPKNITWSHKGVCESVLYSIPHKFHNNLLLLLSQIINGYFYIDIEHMLYSHFCPNDDLSNVKNVKELYVVGMMAGHPGVYNRI